MRAALAILAAFALMPPAEAQARSLSLPSGAVAQPLPVVWDEDMSAIRLRFVVDQLQSARDAYFGDGQQPGTDMQWICDTHLQQLNESGTDLRDDGWTGIVVTLMDREVDFGTVDTTAFQLFEWFRIDAEGCTLDLGSHE